MRSGYVWERLALVSAGRHGLGAGEREEYIWWWLFLGYNRGDREMRFLGIDVAVVV